MLCVIGISVLLNTIGYLIFHNMVAIAVATLITNIIWYIIGEIDLKKYAFRFNDYVFFVLNMVAYLLCGLNFDAVLGFSCYSVIAIMSALILEFDVCKKLFMETMRHVRKFSRKKKQ